MSRVAALKQGCCLPERQQPAKARSLWREVVRNREAQAALRLDSFPNFCEESDASACVRHVSELRVWTGLDVNNHVLLAAGDSAGPVYCTNRHMTVSVYGRPDGSVLVRRMNPIGESCAYDGTHY